MFKFDRFCNINTRNCYSDKYQRHGEDNDFGVKSSLHRLLSYIKKIFIQFKRLYLYMKLYNLKRFFPLFGS